MEIKIFKTADDDPYTICDQCLGRKRLFRIVLLSKNIIICEDCLEELESKIRVFRRDETVKTLRKLTKKD